MDIPNIAYRLEDGRLWLVPEGRWLDEAACASAGDCEGADPAPDVMDLRSADGDGGEAYLARTLEFYGWPLGELAERSPAALKARLAALDAEWLRPRTLAGLATGDPEALARWGVHEAQAEPIRARLAELAGNAADSDPASAGAAGGE